MVRLIIIAMKTVLDITIDFFSLNLLQKVIMIIVPKDIRKGLPLLIVLKTKPIIAPISVPCILLTPAL